MMARVRYIFQIIYLIMIFINTVKNLLNLILTIYIVQKNGQRYDSLSGFGFRFFTNNALRTLGSGINVLTLTTFIVFLDNVLIKEGTFITLFS